MQNFLERCVFLPEFTKLRLFSLFYTCFGIHVNDILKKLSFSDMNLVTLSENHFFRATDHLKRRLIIARSK